jgi:hypothetical protein
MTVRIQPHHDCLDAHRSGRIVAFQEKLVHETRKLGFDRIELQPLLDPSRADARPRVRAEPRGLRTRSNSPATTVCRACGANAAPDPETFHQIRKVGVNINQIAHRFNALNRDCGGRTAAGAGRAARYHQRRG